MSFPLLFRQLFCGGANSEKKKNSRETSWQDGLPRRTEDYLAIRGISTLSASRLQGTQLIGSAACLEDQAEVVSKWVVQAYNPLPTIPKYPKLWKPRIFITPWWQKLACTDNWVYYLLHSVWTYFPTEIEMCLIIACCPPPTEYIIYAWLFKDLKMLSSI